MLALWLANPMEGEKLFKLHFSHMRFIQKTDFKQSVSYGSVKTLSTSKIKSVFLLALGFASDSSCCS